MAAQLLIESQGPASDGESRFLRAAGHLAATGSSTVVFLTDDGVTSALAFQSAEVDRVVRAGASVWADQVSLTERDIQADQLASGVVPTDLDKITPLLFAPDVKVVWH